MFQKTLHFLLFLSLFSVFSSALADDDYDHYDDSPAAIHAALDAAALKNQVTYDRCPACWYFGMGVGGAWVKPISIKQTILSDQYNNNNPNTSPILLIQTGYRWATHRHWFPNFYLGGRYRYFFSHNINGNVLIGSNPNASNYTFSVSSTINLLTLSGQLDLCEFNGFAPFISFGAGFAFNYFNQYSESPNLGVAARNNPSFASKNNIDLAYEAGAGLSYYVGPQLFLSAEYDYINTGALSSKVGSYAWSSQTMNFGDTASQTILFSMSYLFHGS